MPERCDTCAYGKTVYGKQNFIRYLKCYLINAVLILEMKVF
jgi:hypothetical protein